MRHPAWQSSCIHHPPDRPIWVYHKKTFDVDNYNKVDSKTLVYMKKNEAGKLVGQDTSFL